MIREGYFAGAGNELPGPFTALLGQNQWLGGKKPLNGGGAWPRQSGFVRPPLEDSDQAALIGPGVMARARLKADEVAGAKNLAVAIGQLTLEDDEFLEAWMLMGDGARAGLHAHEIAALAFLAVEADGQPADIRLQRSIQIVRQEFYPLSCDDPPCIALSSHFLLLCLRPWPPLCNIN